MNLLDFMAADPSLHGKINLPTVVADVHPESMGDRSGG